MYRREIAYHEAGHVVVHAIYGHPICEITIRPDPDKGSAGHVESAFGGIIQRNCIADDALRMELLRQLVRASYAGFAAQCMANPQADREGSSQDYLQAAMLAESFLLVGDAHRWDVRQMSAARALVNRHRLAVDAIAAALLKRRTLKPSIARGIVRKHIRDLPEEIDYFNLRGEFWDQESVAQLYRVTATTLARWRREHTGPRAFRIGRYIRYHALPAPRGSQTMFVVDEWEGA